MSQVQEWLAALIVRDVVCVGTHADFSSAIPTRLIAPPVSSGSSLINFNSALQRGHCVTGQGECYLTGGKWNTDSLCDDR
jgi:hypothetical protein